MIPEQERQGGDVDLPFKGLSGKLQELERRSREYKQISEGIKDALPFQGRPFVKTYLEGRLRVLLHFERQASCKGNKRLFLEVFPESRQTQIVHSNDAPIREVSSEPVKGHFGNGGNQDQVLIGDVDLMNGIKPFTLPARVRLYCIEDEVSNLAAGARTRSYLSLDSRRYRLPVLLEGKDSVASGDLPVDFHQSAVCVVKRSAEVVDSIAQYSRRMARKRSTHGHVAPLPFFILCLGEDCFSVFSNEGAKNAFEFKNVLFGPFGL